MIKKNNQTIDKIYKGITEIAKIYKGSTLVYENYRDIVATGNDIINITKAKANSLNYLKAFGKCEQRRLPKGYTELEYLESTGTQYIDTEIVPSNTTGYKVTLNFPEVQSDQSKFGCRNDAGNTRFWFGCSAGKAYYGWGENYPASENRPSISANVDNIVSCNYLNDRACILNGTTAYSNLPTLSFTPTKSIWLFGSNTSTSPIYRLYKISEAIFTENQTVSKYFIPAKRNSDNVLGMYDTVNDVFYTNQGTGTFTAGPEAVPTPSQPLPIVCNNGELKVRHQSGLPLGYQRVSYIYATNYIDLGVKTTDDTELEALWFNRASTSLQYLYRSDGGSALTTNTTAYIATNGNWRFGDKATAISPLEVNVNVTSLQNKEGVWWNGTKQGSYTDIGTFESVDTLKMFSESTTPKVAVSYLKMRSYETKELLHYWVACRREYDKKVGVYDIVGNTFYTNDDATITEDADVTDPIEIYVDGTQETIEITGKNLFDTNRVTDGYFYNYNLELVTSELASLSDFIPVIPGEQYTISWRAASAGFNVRVNFFNKDKEIQSQSVYSIATSGYQTYTVTVPNNMYFVRYSFRTINVSTQQFEAGSTATPYESYYNGGTATCENLLSVGSYEDIQEAISGGVTRNVNAIVLTGGEEWTESATSDIYYFVPSDSLYIQSSRIPVPSTHFMGTDTTNANMPDNSIKAGPSATIVNHDAIWVKMTSAGNLTDFKQYLTDQYNAGTPVIVVYPLATPTTEAVTGQPMSLQAGTNIIEVTEASLDNLGLEAKYKGK